MKSCIVAIARLESPYIIEWIEYHLKLGFDKIVIYDNNWDKKENLIDVDCYLISVDYNQLIQ